eukprot:2358488-Rhodomonas_salina.1
MPRDLSEMQAILAATEGSATVDGFRHAPLLLDSNGLAHTGDGAAAEELVWLHWCRQVAIHGPRIPEGEVVPVSDYILGQIGVAAREIAGEA